MSSSSAQTLVQVAPPRAWNCPRESVEGVRVNEDAFTIQVRDVSGAIHSFRKDELQAFDKVFGHSLMPGYETVLNARDLDDVVSYLMSLKE